MISAILPRRTPDEYGSGAFGAPRGGRTHKGIDYQCQPGTKILSPVVGTVTKLGYPYGDDLSYRYVEVTDGEQLRHRVFYCAPMVEVGDLVSRHTVIGEAQHISARYPHRHMNNHVHYEVKTVEGRYIDPESLG